MKCPLCITHPQLCQSGWSAPKDWRCPVCDRFFNARGQIFDPTTQAQAQEQKDEPPVEEYHWI